MSSAVRRKIFITMTVIMTIMILLSSRFQQETNHPVDLSVQATEIPIVMYHHISSKPNAWNKYVISPELFEQDLIYLKKNGYETITVNQLIDHVYNGTALPSKPIMLTFDDGQESFLKYALPLLEKYDMSAVVAIVGSYADKYSAINDHNYNYSYLTWDEINELTSNSHVEFQNHTYDMHTTDNRKGCKIKTGESFETYKQILTDDLQKLQSEFMEHTGTQPTTLVYPFGYRCAEAVTIIKELGFQAALTCEEKVNTITDNPDDLFSLGRFNRPAYTDTADFFSFLND